MKWIRPILISFMVLSVTAGFFLKYIGGEAFFGFSTGLVVWWFKSRDSEKERVK